MQSLSSWKKKILLQTAQRACALFFFVDSLRQGPCNNSLCLAVAWRVPDLVLSGRKTGREFGVRTDKSFREYSSSEPLLSFGVRAPICVQHWLQPWQELKALCTSNCGFPFSRVPVGWAQMFRKAMVRIPGFKLPPAKKVNRNLE